MADQTSSTIVIAAPPAQVMDVIADFPRLPRVGAGDAHGRGARDVPRRARQGRLLRDPEGPIKDSYTLTYDWHGDESVDWTLVSGKMLKKLDGTYDSGAARAGPPR